MAQSKTQRIDNKGKTSVIQTTFFDLIRELGELTDDDNLVIAAATHLLRSARARAPRLMAPVKVVGRAPTQRQRPA
ncbi:MAG: hypothetical protein HYT78_17095 [Deltaproteobacteria bacterium]|nr:hypothetical protein [Deltaproteobacteria bacterium]